MEDEDDDVGDPSFDAGVGHHTSEEDEDDDADAAASEPVKETK